MSDSNSKLSFSKFIIRGIMSMLLPSIVTTVALRETTEYLVERPVKYVYDSVNKVKLFIDKK
jgi:hypothetical protein